MYPQVPQDQQAQLEPQATQVICLTHAPSFKACMNLQWASLGLGLLHVRLVAINTNQLTASSCRPRWSNRFHWTDRHFSRLHMPIVSLPFQAHTLTIRLSCLHVGCA